MSDLAEKFSIAQGDVQQLSKKPSNDDLLQLYALYKQSTVGDAEGSRPGFMDMVGRAKYDAWAKLSGIDQDEAMQLYIDLVVSLKG